VRKIFLSYKRSARLNDADLVLLLGTPNLGKSEWVVKEIAVANATEVPLLAVLWPDPDDPGRAAPLPPEVYNASDLEGLA
jgi:hypothetical protein